MKLLYHTIVIVLTLCSSLNTYSQACNNVDFEDGNFTGWTGFTGSCCPISATTPGLVLGQHTIMSGTGTDGIIPAIPVVSPYGGTYSVKLGNENVGAQAEKLVYQLAVTAQNPNFTYQYAVILEDPNHPAAEQPRFQVNIKNQSGNTIPCGFYNVVAGAGVPGFQTQGSIIWKNWSLVAVDLTAYIGQTVTVEFQTGDCEQQGHFGYAYIDASCNPLVITSNYCPGDVSAVLTAPAGFQTYQWTNGATTQSITVNNPNPGDSVKVVCTPYQGTNCATTLKYVFLPYPPVAANFSVNTSCGNSAVVLTDSSTIVVAGAQITGWEWLVNNVVISTQQQFTHAFPTPGTYDIKLISHSNAGCPDTITKQITVPQGMDPGTTVPSTAMYNGYGVSCAGASDGIAAVTVTFGVPPYTFQWGPTVVSSNDTIYNVTDGIYVVTVSDNTGCSVIDTAKVTAPPAIGIAPVVENIMCYGETTGSIEVNGWGGMGNLTYNWSHNSSAHVNKATGLVAANYGFTVIDGNSCAYDSAIDISQPLTPYDVVGGPTSVTCFNDCTGTIDITSVTGNTFPYTFAWSTNPVQTSQTAQNLCAGPYTVTITDLNSCTTTATYSIIQPPQLVVNITATDVLCNGGSDGTATANVSGGATPYTYLWSEGSQTQTITGLIASPYTVDILDNSQCTASASVNVNQPAAMGITSAHRDVACNGGSTGQAAVIVNGGLTPYTYAWNTTPAQTQPIANNLPANTYNVTATDKNGCTVTATETINEPTLLTAAISNTVDNICFGASAGSATVTAGGGSLPYVYVWNTSPVQNAATATLLPQGNYNVTVTDDSLCTATATTLINQPPQITIAEVVVNALCYDSTQGSIALTVNGGTPGYTYTWLPNVSNTDNAQNLLAGTYNVTVADANACTETRSYNITQPTQLVIAAQAVDALCNGSADGQITVSAQGGTPSYTYSLLQGGSQVGTNGTGQFNGLTANSYTAQFADANNCVITTPAIVNEPTPLVIQTISADSVNCYGYSDGSVSVTAAGATPPYTYTLDNTNNNTGQFGNLIKGIYPVTITDAHNCSLATTAIVNEPTPIILTAVPDSLVLVLGETKPINVSSNYDPTATYSWQPWQGLDCETCPNVNVTLYNDYEYTVEVVTHPHDLDCETSLRIPVTVIPKYDVFVPNVFTPNGDGINDFFEFFGNKPAIKQMDMMVFNRNGEKVFNSADINFKWDGTFKGVLQNPAVFVYVFKVVFLDNHVEETFKGSVTLVR